MARSFIEYLLEVSNGRIWPNYDITEVLEAASLYASQFKQQWISGDPSSRNNLNVVYHPMHGVDLAKYDHLRKKWFNQKGRKLNFEPSHWLSLIDVPFVPDDSIDEIFPP